MNPNPGRPDRSDRPDRPARIRAALRALVAERGFHGASMSAVAERAGVATGTAYVHYGSKEELVLAAHRETKAELSAAAMAGDDPDRDPAERFRHIWANIYRHLADEPERARFLVQVDASPFAAGAHEPAPTAADDNADDTRGAAEADDELARAMDDVAEVLVDLPPVILFELALGPAITTIASGQTLTTEQQQRLAHCCWRAVTVAG